IVVRYTNARKPTTTPVPLLADEDNIPGGIGDTTSPGDDAQSGLTGTLLITDATSVNFASLHQTAVLDTSSAAGTSGGTPLTFFWDPASGTLFASTNATSLANAQNTAAFKFQVAASSPFNYTFTLLKQVDHPSGAGTADDNTENPNVFITLTYTAV